MTWLYYVINQTSYQDIKYESKVKLYFRYDCNIIKIDFSKLTYINILLEITLIIAAIIFLIIDYWLTINNFK